MSWFGAEQLQYVKRPAGGSSYTLSRRGWPHYWGDLHYQLHYIISPSIKRKRKMNKNSKINAYFAFSCLRFFLNWTQCQLAQLYKNDFILSPFTNILRWHLYNFASFPKWLTWLWNLRPQPSSSSSSFWGVLRWQTRGRMKERSGHCHVHTTTSFDYITGAENLPRGCFVSI